MTKAPRTTIRAVADDHLAVVDASVIDALLSAFNIARDGRELHELIFAMASYIAKSAEPVRRPILRSGQELKWTDEARAILIVDIDCEKAASRKSVIEAASEVARLDPWKTVLAADGANEDGIEGLKKEYQRGRKSAAVLALLPEFRAFRAALGLDVWRDRSKRVIEETRKLKKAVRAGVKASIDARFCDRCGAPLLPTKSGSERSS